MTPCGGGIACKVAQQDFAYSLILAADEAHTQEEAAESIIFVVGLYNLGQHSLLVSRHLAQLINELGVGFNFLRLCGCGKPGEVDCVLGDYWLRRTCTEGTLDEVSFALSQTQKVLQRLIGEGIPGHGNNQAALFLASSVCFLPSKSALLQ